MRSTHPEPPASDCAVPTNSRRHALALPKSAVISAVESVWHFVPVGATEARVGSGAAEAAEVAEVELVQRDRAHQRELFALEPAQAVRWRLRVERGKLAADGVQRSHGVPVVVFVVTNHHLFRDSVERRRAYGDRGDLLLHRHSPLFTLFLLVSASSLVFIARDS